MDYVAVIKLNYHPVIGPIPLGTCIIFKLSSERISPHGDGSIFSMSHDHSCCILINIFRAEIAILISVTFNGQPKRIS